MMCPIFSFVNLQGRCPSALPRGTNAHGRPMVAPTNKKEVEKSTSFFLLNCKLLACLFDSHSHGNGHTNHGVVTSADEAHHLNASGLQPQLRGESLGLQALRCKPFTIIALQNLYTLNTSFSVLLNALYRVLMCSYILQRNFRCDFFANCKRYIRFQPHKKQL